MKASEIVDLINTIEQDFPVDQWKINGIHVWPLIRIQLGLDLLMDLFCQSQATTVEKQRTPRIGSRIRGHIRRQLRFVKASWADREHNVGHLGRASALFLSDGVSFTTIGGTNYERFCDPMRDYLGSLDMSSILLTPLDKYMVPRYASSRFIQPAIDWIQLKVRLRRSACSTEEELPGIEEFLARVSKEFRLAAPSLPVIRHRVTLVEEFSHYFGSIIRQVRPQVCFLVSYYWLVGYGLLLACKRAGVESVDIQHGFQGDIHPAYGRWLRVPQAGYELLPSVFWSWSETEVEVIERWSSSAHRRHRAIVGGNVFLDMWRANTLTVVKDYEAILSQKCSTRKTHTDVLVTLQNGLMTEQFVQLLLSVIGDMAGRVRWWIRLHPVMLGEREKVRALFGCHPNVEIDLATDLPLYALLRHMDAHITHSSSVVLEAEAFGVSSVICSRYGMEFFPEQTKRGTAVYAGMKEELTNAIDRQSAQRGKADVVAAEGAKQLEHAYEMLRELVGVTERSDSLARCIR